MPETPEPTPLAEAAAQMHEMFQTLVNTGFTESQALRLLGTMMAESIKNG